MKTQPLGKLAWVFAEVYLHALEPELKELDLEQNEFFILNSLMGRTEAACQADLSKCLGKDPALIVRILDKMEKRGLISRVKDPNDRRVYHIEMTEKSISMKKDMNRAVQRANKRAGQNLSDDELSKLYSLLEKVILIE
jgi:DNA-binding MarR family transcriptional regulator